MDSIITQVTKEQVQQEQSQQQQQQEHQQQDQSSKTSSLLRQRNKTGLQRRIVGSSSSTTTGSGEIINNKSSNSSLNKDNQSISASTSTPASNFLRKLLNSCCCCVRKQAARNKDGVSGSSGGGGATSGSNAWNSNSGGGDESRNDQLFVGGGGGSTTTGGSSSSEDEIDSVSAGVGSMGISSTAPERGSSGDAGLGIQHQSSGSSSGRASAGFLLPPCLPQDRSRPCMVIDLDETLVHSSFKPISNADFIVPVEIDGVVHQVYVAKRPYVDEFLQKMGELYECVLFTASLAKYADPVADLLDKWGVFRTRLFRDACVFHRGNYVKDLNKLGRSLHRVVIVDNSPASYIFHPDNAVPVASWFDDASDTELLYLIPFFERLSSVDNVYTVLRNSNHPYNSISKDTTTTSSSNNNPPTSNNVINNTQSCYNSIIHSISPQLPPQQQTSSGPPPPPPSTSPPPQDNYHQYPSSSSINNPNLITSPSSSSSSSQFANNRTNIDS